jgi:secondary thiamine-phosphate synthase enzyme
MNAPSRALIRQWQRRPRRRRQGGRVLEQAHHRITIETRGPGFTDVTARLATWLGAIGAGDGLVTLFVRHTSASLTIQENADPDVLRDLADALERAAPRQARYRHGIEGPDDMPAHIKSMLTSTSLGIPVVGGRPALGTWQAVYLVEHRDAPHARELALHYVGSIASADG